MARRILRRLAVSLLLVALVLTLLFFLLHLAPGDPLLLWGGEEMPPEAREHLRELYGLDRPLVVQYFDWLGNVLRWDWGNSLAKGRPVSAILGEALPASLTLAAAALIVNLVAGLVLALVAVRWRERFADHAIRIGALALYAMPSFWLGLVAIWVFSYQLGWLPGSGMLSPGATGAPWWARTLDMARHLTLPALVLGISSMAGTLRLLRGELLDALGEDYVRTARAKGLSERRVLGVHALRNALVPVVEIIGLRLPTLMNGVLVIEVVFGWPGLGRITIDAILTRDYPVVLAATALSSLLVLAGSLLADLLHAVLDPRVRHA